MSQVANSQPRQVEKLYESFDYMEFVLSRMIGKADEAAYAVQQDFTDERFPAVSDILAAQQLVGAANLTATDGNKFQVYNLIQIDNEIEWVTAVAANVVTTTRGGSIGSTAAQHEIGAIIYIVSTATPENVAAVASATARGDTVTNFMQIYQRALKVSDRQDNAGSYHIGKGKAEGPSHEYAWELARQFRVIARELEQQAWRGAPFAGTAGGLPSIMGGIPAYITTNVLDLASQPFTPMQVMDNAQLAWNQGGPTGMSRMIFAGAVARRALSSFYKVNVNQKATDKRISLVVDEVETDLGTFQLAEANFWIPPALVVCIDPDNYKWKEWSGYGAIHKSNLAIDGAYQKGAITCDKTIICGGNRVSWKFTSVSTTAADYPSLNG
jgi:hypothetical protein